MGWLIDERWFQWIESLQRFGFYGNSLLAWAFAGVIFFVVLLALKTIKAILLHRASALEAQLERDWPGAVAQLLQRTWLPFLLLVAGYAASLALVLPPRALPILQAVVVLSLLVQGALWANAALSYSVNRYAKRRITVDPNSVTMVSSLGFIGRLAVWAVALLLALENLGVNITALVAGLGIGGIAVALAAQSVLSDLFASLSIVLDKPFVLGDFIIVGEHLGTVEHIGLKTTRLRSLSGEQLVFSNNDLLQSRIRNFKRMAERRVLFSFGVVYQTPYAKLAAISDIVREVIESQEQVRFDRAHFREYGDFALIFEVVYHVLVADFNTHARIQQAINLELYNRFEREDIQFAYPTQTLYLHRMAGNSG